VNEFCHLGIGKFQRVISTRYGVVSGPFKRSSSFLIFLRTYTVLPKSLQFFAFLLKDFGSFVSLWTSPSCVIATLSEERSEHSRSLFSRIYLAYVHSTCGPTSVVVIIVLAVCILQWVSVKLFLVMDKVARIKISNIMKLFTTGHQLMTAVVGLYTCILFVSHNGIFECQYLTL
jgi:hypothetical protein